MVSYLKEISDTEKLAKIISGDKWVDSNTIIVTCSPDYSSISSQILNHKLSHLNHNDLFERLDLEMPYPVSSQVYYKGEYIHYEQYLKEWTSSLYSAKYLFHDSGVIRGKNFSKLRYHLKLKLEPDNYRFSSLYVEESAIFTPDYYVEKYSHPKQGGLIFEWENPLNPNWNY